MKKITVIIATLRSGGSERVCVTVVNGLVHLGWKVDLLVGNLKEERYLSDIHKDVNLICLNSSKPRYSFFSLLKYFKKGKPEILLSFSNEFIPFLAILKILQKKSIKIILRNRSIYSEKKRNRKKNKNIWSNFVRAPLIDYFYSKIDFILNQSYAMQDDFLKNFPKLLNKSSVINNPVSNNIEYFIKSVDNNLNKKKSNYILCVARLNEVKALHFAIIAFVDVVKKNPNYRLKIVGEGPLKNELKELAVKKGIIEFVDFEGYQNNLAQYYLEAKLTVLTSLHEGFPNVLIESIFCGTPVVSFDCPSGPRELLENGKWGTLVPVGNTEALAQAINKNIKDPYPKNLNLRAKDFSSSNILQKYQKLLINLSR